MHYDKSFNNPVSNHPGNISAADIVLAGCLKATCPGRLGLNACRVLRGENKCESFFASRGQKPRTSSIAWWLR